MMKKEAGFTLVEVLAVIVLLGLLLSMIWNVLVQNAFQQKRVEDEIDVNDSAKALLNNISDIVMEQNPPVVKEKEFVSDDIVERLVFNNDIVLEKSSENSYLLGDKEYKYIKEVRANINDNGRGMTVIIIGDNDRAKVELNGTFYTRNT